MMFLEKPTDFNPKFEVTSCFLENKTKFLLLRRREHKNEGGTWGAPAGKIEKGESIIDATRRELLEETGVDLPKEKFKYWGKVFVRYPNYDFIYYMYSADFPKENIIKINQEEHDEFKWVTPLEGLSLNLIPDEDTSIKLFYKLL